MAEVSLLINLPLSRRILIMAAVVLSSTLYATTLLVASTLLPQMQGSFAATTDEIAWTTTFNILATAIVTPMTSFLLARFGRRRLMVGCVTLFTIATWMCGEAESLEAIVFWRIVQGGAGAPVIPMANTTVLDLFPRERHGIVSSIFGMTVVLGPVIGPAAGGILAEAYNWRWAFFMIVPAGILATLALRFALPVDGPNQPTPLDWTGFLTLAVALAALQLLLARGERLDWFESGEIQIEALIAALAFFLYLAHSLTAKQPFLNLGLLRDRNYAVGMLLVTIYGMVNFTPTVLLPSLLQGYAGYPDSIIGEIVGYRGIGGTLGFGATLVIGRWDPRIGLALGFGVLVAQGLWLMSLDLNVGANELLANSVLQGFGVGVVWVPLTLLTFATLDARYRAEAMSLFHLLRNIGSSFFISVSVSEILRSGAKNYSRMTEMITPTAKTLQNPQTMGGWTIDTLPGLTAISKEITRQAVMIGYLNAFAMYTVACAAAIALAFLARGRPRAAGG